MYKLEIKLKQHTPLIHFQHTESGATLRATELKPKLDKFICKNVFKDEFENAKEYLVGYPSEPEKHQKAVNELKEKFEKGFRALDYKILEIRGTNRYNNGQGRVKIIGKFNDWLWFDSIKVNLIFFNLDLKSKIEGVLNDFFLLERFGKRQSKGYGQFSVSNLNGNEIHLNSNEVETILIKYYGSCLSKNKEIANNEINIIENEIDKIHTWLKCGKNYPYEKSPAFLYMIERDKPFRWEKRLIKRAIDKQQTFNFELDYKKQPIDLKEKNSNRFFYLNDFRDNEDLDEFDEDFDRKTEYKFVRALLGLAEHYEFKVYESPNKFFVAGVKSEDKIERFQSPITYRFIENKIFVTAEKIPDFIFDKKFYFNLKMKERRNNEFVYATTVIDNLLSEVGFDNFIKTPTHREFILQEFLDKYLISRGFQKTTTNAN